MPPSLMLLLFVVALSACDESTRARAAEPTTVEAGGSKSPLRIGPPKLTAQQRREWSGALQFFSVSYNCPLDALTASIHPEHPREVLVKGCGEEMSYSGHNGNWTSVEVRF